MILIRIAVLDDYLDAVNDVADWDRLPDGAEVCVFTDHLTGEDAIAERLQDFTVVVGMRERTPFPRALLKKLPNLALLVTLGKSNRSFDIPAATELGIVVSGTGGTESDPMELTWALILALARNVPREDKAIRSGRWQTSIGVRLACKTLGILGLGNVGAQVARVAKAFDMSVIAWSKNLTAERARACGAELVSKQDLLARSDIVTLHLRLSDRTRETIGESELEQMKPTALLINTARSGLVDEGALVDALRNGTLAGAALDVFDQEPLPAAHPLLSLGNTVLMPHQGGVTVDRLRSHFDLVIENILTQIDGNPVRVLNPEVLRSPDLRWSKSLRAVRIG